VIARAARAFGHFWWDFLIGDTPEFAVVTLVVVGLGALLHHDRAVGIVVLPATVLVSVAVSSWRVRRAR
jgi:hypothetical protein